jgi:PAS domain S-box-containing protein
MDLSLEHLERPPRISKIPLLIFLIASLGIAATGWWVYSKGKVRTRQAAEENLDVIANLKVRQIAEWRRERLADAAVISRNPFNVLRVIPFLTHPTPGDTGADIRAWLESLQEGNHYHDVLLLDGQGRVRLAVNFPGRDLSPPMQARVADVLRRGEPQQTDFYWSETSKRVLIALIVPLAAPGDKQAAPRSAGVIVLRIDPSIFLYPLIQVWPTPSPTAETLLVRREGEDVLFLNELRHRQDTALTLKFPIRNLDLPAAQAMRGLKGIVAGRDYRGVEVFAAICQVPDSSWFMIAKVDQKEILAPFAIYVRGIVIITGGLIMIMGMALLWWGERREAAFYHGQYEAARQRQALVKHFDYLTRYANDIIILSDADLKIVEANDRTLTVYGYSRDELLEMSMRDLRDPQAQPDLEEVLHRLEREKGLVYETAHRRRDGAALPVEISVRLIEVEDRKFYQAIIRDITERQQAEAEIRALNLELEGRVQERTAQLVAANRELEAFSYSVSHDLRAPLRGIDGWTLAFLEDYAQELDDQGRTYLERVRTETQHMGQLIDDLLSLSRVGRAEMQREPVDLTALARGIIGRLRESGPERLVEFVVQEGLNTVADPQLIEIALSNLLDNAWKFTGKCPAGLIEFGRVQQGGQQVLFVRDNGAGFDPAYADKLFGAFQRLHKASEFPGTGIGLATVQRILHRHGGRVWAEAAVDRGATFYFTL